MAFHFHIKNLQFDIYCFNGVASHTVPTIWYDAAPHIEKDCNVACCVSA